MRFDLVADAVASRLLRGGTVRLVMVGDDGANLGGWNREAVRRVVEQELRKHAGREALANKEARDGGNRQG